MYHLRTVELGRLQGSQAQTVPGLKQTLESHGNDAPAAKESKWQAGTACHES